MPRRSAEISSSISICLMRVRVWGSSQVSGAPRLRAHVIPEKGVYKYVRECVLINCIEIYKMRRMIDEREREKGKERKGERVHVRESYIRCER